MKLIFSHLEPKCLTLYFDLLQYNKNAREAHPKRLRSLDTFRGYV